MRCFRLAPGLFALIFGLWLGGCAATAPPAGHAPTTPAMPDAPASPRAASDAKTSAAEVTRAEVVEQQLRAAAARWYGTPYRYGGDDRDGIDCSAFAQALYLQALGLSLPRVTAEQVHEGVPVRPPSYQPGDLVFFRPEAKTRHVGVYLGDGEFVHASSSQGVTLASIDDPYWQSVYWTTRRLLPELSLAAAPEREPASERQAASERAVMPEASWSRRPPPPRPASRSGW